MSETERKSAAREWGPWSVWKTELILTPYIHEFLNAGVRSRHRTFIDCYAGAAINRERETGRQLVSSIEMALRARSTNWAEFTHLAACEMPERAADIEQRFAPSSDGQQLCVFPGDVNQTIREVFQWWESEGDARSGPRFGQAFAYVDPNKHTDLSWDLVEFIGRERPERPRRVEQLILLPLGTMRRELPVKQGSSTATDDAVAAVDRMFGNVMWRTLYARQRRGELEGDDAWRRYSDLYRWSLRNLGYRYVTAIEAVNTTRTMQYHLIHASDHHVGSKIFHAVCEHAKTELPRLLEVERDLVRRGGKAELFDLDSVPLEIDEPPARLFDGDPDLDEILHS